MLNQLVAVGRLVSSELNKETKVCDFKITVPRTNEEVSDIIICRANGNVGENLQTYCVAGDVVGIRGRIVTEENTYYVLVDRITFLSTRKED